MSTINTYILVFDQCLYIPSLDVNLLCVDQMRDHGLKVNGVPSFFKCRAPMPDEIESGQNTTVHMTSSITWEPYDENTNQMEEILGRKSHPISVKLIHRPLILTHMFLLVHLYFLSFYVILKERFAA